jgi:hypothetical protein
MLAFHLLKGGGGPGVVAVLQLIQGDIVKIIDRSFDVSVVFATQGATAQHERQGDDASASATTTIVYQSSAPIEPVQTSKQRGRLSSQTMRHDAKIFRAGGDGEEEPSGLASPRVET